MCIGNKATLNFYLTSFAIKSDMINAIRNIQYDGGGTNTAGGLQLMRTEIFSHANGDRVGVQNVAIVITDGDPDNLMAVISEVVAVKRAGIRIVGVAVGDTVSFSHLLCTFHGFSGLTANCTGSRRG